MATELSPPPPPATAPRILPAPPAGTDTSVLQHTLESLRAFSGLCLIPTTPMQTAFRKQTFGQAPQSLNHQDSFEMKSAPDKLRR